MCSAVGSHCSTCGLRFAMRHSQKRLRSSCANTTVSCCRSPLREITSRSKSFLLRSTMQKGVNRRRYCVLHLYHRRSKRESHFADITAKNRDYQLDSKLPCRQDRRAAVGVILCHLLSPAIQMHKRTHSFPGDVILQAGRAQLAKRLRQAFYARLMQHGRCRS